MSETPLYLDERKRSSIRKYKNLSPHVRETFSQKYQPHCEFILFCSCEVENLDRLEGFKHSSQNRFRKSSLRV